jgi:hypothetical protein
VIRCLTSSDASFRQSGADVDGVIHQILPGTGFGSAGCKPWSQQAGSAHFGHLRTDKQSAGFEVGDAGAHRAAVLQG